MSASSPLLPLPMPSPESRILPQQMKVLRNHTRISPVIAPQALQRGNVLTMTEEKEYVHFTPARNRQLNSFY